MGQEKFHKKCVHEVQNRAKGTHQFYKEFPIFVEGNIHFIDTVGFPHKDKPYLKPMAVECESGSSRLQQESNMRDLKEFKRRYPDAEIFQVNDAEQVNFSRLNRGKELKKFSQKRF